MTQRQKIIHRLNTHGEISRNYCLSQYISRLGALIGTLKKEGWVFTANYEQTENGKDYVYRVLKNGRTTLPPAFKIPIRKIDTKQEILL